MAIELECLTLLLTWRCPAQCAHCVFESGPAKKSVIDMEIARAAIHAAAERSPGVGLSFSGGEPFVALEEMQELIGLASTLGLASEICTSAAWVSTEVRALTALRSLQDRGLQVLAVSFDRHHLPYIPHAKVATALRAGLALGLRVVLKTLEGDGHVSDPVGVAEALGLSRTEVERITIKPQRIVEVGRATEAMASLTDGVALGGGGCRLAGSNPTVTPEGHLYTCCGPIVGQGPKAAELFLFDDGPAGIGERLTAMEGDLFVGLLRSIGPAGIIAEASRRADTPPAIRTPVNQCDLCVEMTRNPPLGKAVKKMLADVADHF